MNKKITTYETDNGRGKAEVYYDFGTDKASIKYYDDHNHAFFTEEFENTSLMYVQDFAEAWANGTRQIADLESI